MATRIALGIEYDGSCFLGWQTQPGGGTVQDALQTALSGIADEAVSVVCAGRTDRGVHGRGQVVHFETNAQRPDSAWVRGVNALLPEAVAVLWSQRVAADFHARYCAVSRTYRYVLLNRPVRPALAARHAGWQHAPLEVAPMRVAARQLLGEQDFSAFRAADCQAKSPLRTLHRIDIERQGEYLEFTLCANAWLQHMVRNIVGTLVYVGKGKHPPLWAKKVLESRDRSLAAPTFGPEGLYLDAVEYDQRWGIPATASRARVLSVES